MTSARFKLNPWRKNEHSDKYATAGPSEPPLTKTAFGRDLDPLNSPDHRFATVPDERMNF